MEFCDEYYIIYSYTNNNHIQAKKNKKWLPFKNGGQMTDFCFTSFRFRRKLKKTFPKGIFQWNLNRRSRLYNHWWNKNLKFLFRCDFTGKTQQRSPHNFSTKTVFCKSVSYSIHHLSKGGWVLKLWTFKGAFMFMLFQFLGFKVLDI